MTPAGRANDSSGEGHFAAIGLTLREQEMHEYFSQTDVDKADLGPFCVQVSGAD